MDISASESTSSLWRKLLPGGIGSFVIHLLILLLASSSMRGCEKGMPGTPGGEVLREIGLFVVDGSEDGRSDNDAPETGGSNAQPVRESENASDPDPGDEPATTDDRELQDPVTPETVVPREAPRISDLLAQPNATDSPAETADGMKIPDVIGAGSASGLPQLPGSPSGLIKPSASSGSTGRAASGASVPGPGQTTFMNIADSGRSFVYLIDISGSMAEQNRLELARSQLKSSLRLLQPTQEFQIIFYSDYPLRMRLSVPSKRPMFYATAAILELASRQIDTTTPQSGTQHKPALLDAISLRPDVIYFLTDGREPALSPADMNEIRRMVGDIKIHVVEFGSDGLADRSDSWLQKLARMTGGEYRRYNPGSR